MKLILAALPVELTEAGWKAQKSIFQNATGLSAELRDFETKYTAVQKDMTDEKFQDAYKALLSARLKLYNKAGALYMKSAKSPIVPKKSAEYVQKVTTAASNINNAIVHGKTA